MNGFPTFLALQELYLNIYTEFNIYKSDRVPKGLVKDVLIASEGTYAMAEKCNLLFTYYRRLVVSVITEAQVTGCDWPLRLIGIFLVQTVCCRSDTRKKRL